MATFAERLLKQRMSNTGYGRTPPPPPPAARPQQRPATATASQPQPPTRPPASSIPPGEPPSDDSIDLTSDGLIVRRRRPVNTSPSMGDLDIDLNIQAPITNRTRG
jgi:hypothetical protein